MIKFPFTSMQQLNLDWLLQTVKKILDFFPINSGVAGDVLQRGTDGATWQPLAAVSLDIHSLNPTVIDGSDEIPVYDTALQGNYKISLQDILDVIPVVPVDSVNGQTGTVVLDKTDIGLGNVDNVQQYSASNPPPYPVTSVNGQTGDVSLSIPNVWSVNSKVGSVVLDKTDIGLGNVDNVQQYSASNPPPYPVTSVNGQTGDIVIGAGGMNATLLWTNSDVLHSFAAQTIAIDLSTYSFVIIEYVVGEGGTVSAIKTDIFSVPTLPPPTGYASYNIIQGCYFSGSDVKIGIRRLQVSTSGVTFTIGTRVEELNNSNASDDTLCRPTRIWGIS